MTSSADNHAATADTPEQIVLGEDTHNEVHVAAVITVMGVLLGTKAFPATAGKRRRAYKQTISRYVTASPPSCWAQE